MTLTTVTLHPQNGWHWKEWLAQSAGTAVLLFAVVTAQDLAVRAGSPVSILPWRSVITTLAAGVAVAVVAVSAIGSRSGAHLNPALTFGLWLQRTVSSADLAAYCTAQLAGGVLGVTLARLWGPTVTRPAVEWALLKPAASIPQPAAAGLESAATLVELTVLFILRSSRRYNQWAPAAAAGMLAVAFGLAPVSGGDLNPIRGLAPDELAGAYPALWIYIAGPLLGATFAAVALTASGRRPVTGKLRHDPSIHCHMRCTLSGPPGHGADQGPHKPATGFTPIHNQPPQGEHHEGSTGEGRSRHRRQLGNRPGDRHPLG
jgi:aquaporin Z